MKFPPPPSPGEEVILYNVRTLYVYLMVSGIVFLWTWTLVLTRSIGFSSTEVVQPDITAATHCTPVYGSIVCATLPTIS